MKSRAPQGACGLKLYFPDCVAVKCLGRAPQGACGLKYQVEKPFSGLHVSGPARGLWIEIYIQQELDRREHSRAPQGACGLK